MKKNNPLLFMSVIFTLFLSLYSCKEDTDLFTGVIDEYGDWASLYPVKMGDKYGYIDATGNISITPVFEYDNDEFNNFFINGMAVVSTDGEDYGFIDTKGNFKISPMYEQAASFGTNGLAWVDTGDDEYFIDKSGLPKVMLNNYKSSHWFFRNGLLGVYDDDWDGGYVDKNGELVIPTMFYSIRSFSEGLAWVRRNYDDKYEAIDKSGKTIIPAAFNYAYTFNEGKAAVNIGDDYGYINTSGDYVIPLQYDWAGTFYDGLACVTIDDKDGFINHNGKIAIQPQFDWAEDFCCGFAAVEIDDKWGFIDKSGNIVIAPIFDEAYYFIGELGMVRFDEEDDGMSYVDRSGQIVWKHSQNKSATIENKKTPRQNKQERMELRNRLHQQFGF